MNYNLISQLVSNGMNGEEILPLLIRNAPQLASKIKKLVVGGWGPNEVLLALQKDPDMGKVSLKNGKPSTPEEIASLKVLQGRRSPDKSRDEQALAQLRSFTGNALKIGAAVGGSYLGGRALQAGMGAVQGMMGGGQPPQPPSPQASPIPPSPSPAPPSPSPAPQIGESIQAQAQAPVAQAMQPQTGNIPLPPNQPMQPSQQVQLPDWMGEKIYELRSTGNGPQEISAYFRKFMPSQIDKFEKEKGVNFDQAIQQHLQQTPIQGKPGPTLKEKQAQGVTTEGMKPTNILEKEQIQPVQEKISPKSEKPKLDINLSKDGRFTPISETIRPGKLPSNSVGRKLSDVTYEQKYKDLNPKEKESFKIIDEAIDKTAKHLVGGKTFTDLLPMKEGSAVQLSTAEDVLRSLLGVPSKYNLMTPEEQEETFNTFQGITPNVIWNTISLIDPRIQKIKRPNPSPKGAKAGKEEMSSNDFRRFLAHSVIGMMEKHKDFGERAKMIVSVVNMLDKFEKKPSKSDVYPDFQNLSDAEFNALLAEVSEEEVKKFR